jgi:2-polyprenyl-3-methyl-5-hydroxy-6-metoxy-1,4-benzoquinol methylase
LQKADVLDQGYFKQDRPEMQRFVPARRGRVLEVGCSEGRFSSSLPGVDETWGIEPSAAAEEARSRLTRVFNATFDEVETELPPAYFDVVICNDVIEHMPDHVGFLRKIKKHIAPGGMIVGSIPNVRYYRVMLQFLLEKDWHYTDSGVLDRTHMAFFTEKSLKRTLGRTGFRVIQSTGINSPTSFSGSLRDKVYLTTAYAISGLTLGYFSDVLQMQFAFQAVLTETV